LAKKIYGFEEAQIQKTAALQRATHSSLACESAFTVAHS
jgi:hypothetical protein